MRDIVVTLIIFGSLPFILQRPHIGILVWSWIGYMNVHRLAWGFAYSFPFAQVVAIVTLVSILFSKEKIKLPVTPISVVLMLFIIHMTAGTFFAVYEAPAMYELTRVFKIQLVIFLTMMLFNSKERINQLVWVIVVSIGFYGIKGGIFSILKGGGSRVWGPPDSFISGNNEMGLALLMTIPMLFYLKETLTKKWQKNLVYISIALMAVSVLGTYSRGAFLALVMMLVFLWLKLPNKLPSAILGIIFAIVALSFMPEKYYDRLYTIQTYEQDSSAMGRINAWTVAVNIAQDRFFAGGFNHWSLKTFQQYAPVANDVHDAHSIYFEVLGEHGFFGFFLFILLYLLTWNKASWIIKNTKTIEELKWCNSLTRMLQVSLVAYASGGAFLGLAYWDMPYHIISLIVVMGVIVKKHKESPQKNVNKATGESIIAKTKRKKWAWEK